MPDLAQAEVARLPDPELECPGEDHQEGRKLHLGCQKRTAADRIGQKQRGRGPVMPARDGLQLGVDHRGGGHSGQGQSRTEPTQNHDPGVEEDQTCTIEGVDG